VKEPAVQFEHEVSPGIDAMVPATHTVHDWLYPMLFWALPAAHDLQVCCWIAS
jgi:hypothetical protein